MEMVFPSLSFAQFAAAAQNGCAGNVTAGDAFGMYYGCGVDSAPSPLDNLGYYLNCWKENNPCEINSALKGPSDGFCPLGGFNADQYERDVKNSRDVRDTKNTKRRALSSGEELNQERNYAEGMEGFFQALRENATNRCGENDRSIAACAKSGTKEKNDPLGRCWKYVKIGLLESGLVDNYIESNSAYEAHEKNILRDAGFCKVNIDNAAKAPVGAILVYSWLEDKVNAYNKNRSEAKKVNVPYHGHIEVKTGDNEYISDFISEKPVVEEEDNFRKFEAAYVKGPCQGESL